jgi:hypothetical protein
MSTRLSAGCDGAAKCLTRGRSTENSIFTIKAEEAVSWLQATLETSLCLVRTRNLPRHVCILDIGAGASHLLDALLEEGFTNMAELDALSCEPRFCTDP